MRQDDTSSETFFDTWLLVLLLMSTIVAVCVCLVGLIILVVEVGGVFGIIISGFLVASLIITGWVRS